MYVHAENSREALLEIITTKPHNDKQPLLTVHAAINMLWHVFWSIHMHNFYADMCWLKIITGCIVFRLILCLPYNVWVECKNVGASCSQPESYSNSCAVMILCILTLLPVVSYMCELCYIPPQLPLLSLAEENVHWLAAETLFKHCHCWANLASLSDKDQMTALQPDNTLQV